MCEHHLKFGTLIKGANPQKPYPYQGKFGENDTLSHGKVGEIHRSTLYHWKK